MPATAIFIISLFPLQAEILHIYQPRSLFPNITLSSITRDNPSPGIRASSLTHLSQQLLSRLSPSRSPTAQN